MIAVSIQADLALDIDKIAFKGTQTMMNLLKACVAFLNYNPIEVLNFYLLFSSVSAGLACRQSFLGFILIKQHIIIFNHDFFEREKCTQPEGMPDQKH
jgi:hypothetical protein